MASVVRLIDDLDGTDADETLLFGVDGVDYEIDLNETNATQLRELLGRFTSAGRRIGTVRHPRARVRAKAAPARPDGAAPGTPRARTAELAKVREWAAANNVEVPSRGRMPEAVIRQYEAATAAA